MKDYKEVAREVFARRDEYLIKQKKRRKVVAAAVSLCAVFCVAVGLAVGYERVWNIDGGVDSVMVTPTPDSTLTTEEKYYSGTLKGSAVADRAGIKSSDIVVYGEAISFEQIGEDILCTLSVEKTLRGDESDTVCFNISESDRKGFMALAKSGKGVFFLKDESGGLSLTHGGSSIFYEAGEDDFRSYDETGLICYYLTMEEIENITEAGL